MTGLSAKEAEKMVKLCSGYEMPTFGLGTQTLTCQVCEDAVYAALKPGYRLIDTAKYYGIESLNATYRNLNRQRSVFPSDQALLKALYLSTFEATKKWTMPLRNALLCRGRFTPPRHESREIQAIQAVMA